ncbi:VWA domain-containing protein [Candidatus Latescibacterota bacterium]
MRRAASPIISLLLLAGATLSPAQQGGPRIDVVFLLDATGSMGDEIAVVKEKIREMISEIALGSPAPDVRFGLVAYRDREDEYVTRVYPLTRDIDQTIDDLHQIEAGGGGDYPESLNEALHVAVHQIDWDEDAAASRLVFLIADAPPHLDYPQDYDYRDESRIAASRDIVVHAIGASGLDELGEEIYREISLETDGQFQWLAYETRYLDGDGEEVVVRVEGREATCTRGDSTWEAGDGFVPGGISVGLGRSDFMDGPGVATAEAGGPASDVTTTTNLDDLITSAIKDAAEESGVEYVPDPTAIESVSWGQAKARIAR